MAGVSSDLIWLLVKKNSSFIKKQNGNSSSSVTFTSEPLNLTGLNSFKYSGLANTKAVGIEAAPSSDSPIPVVTVVTKKNRKGNKPKNSLQKNTVRKSLPSVASALIKQVVASGYRPDLKKAALARLSAVRRSITIAKYGARRKTKTSKKLIEA